MNTQLVLDLIDDAALHEDGTSLGIYTDEELAAVDGEDGGLLQSPVVDELSGRTRDASLRTALRSLAARGVVTASPEDGSTLTVIGDLATVLAVRHSSTHFVVAEHISPFVSESTAFYAVAGHGDVWLEERSRHGTGFHGFGLWRAADLVPALLLRSGLDPDDLEAMEGFDVVRGRLTRERLMEGDGDGVAALNEDLGAMSNTLAIHSVRGEPDGPANARIAIVHAESGRSWAVFELPEGAAAAHPAPSIDVAAAVTAVFGVDALAYA